MCGDMGQMGALLSPQFYCELKIALKNKSYLKIDGGRGGSRARSRARSLQANGMEMAERKGD